MACMLRSYKKRGIFLFDIADLLKKNSNEFAKYESIDNGKPLSLSKKLDIPRAIDNLRFFASIINSNESNAYHMENIGINYTLKQPIVIVGTI